MEEQFLSELHWCITQLELGLETQNANSRQGLFLYLDILHTFSVKHLDQHQKSRYLPFIL